MRNVYLVGSVRTPIGRFGGTLAVWTAADMGVAAAQESLKRAQLTPAQMEKIDPIIDRASAELAAAQTDSRLRVAEIFRKANAQIATELTPEQQKMFAEMEHERLEFLRRKGCSPPPPR